MTDEIGELSETDFATLDKLFELGFHLMIPFIMSCLVQCNEPCYHNYVAVIARLFVLAINNNNNYCTLIVYKIVLVSTYLPGHVIIIVSVLSVSLM